MSNKDNSALIPSLAEMAKTHPILAVVSWISILIVVLQLSWLSAGTIADKWFWLEEKKIDQSYELQIKTLDFLQTDVMWKLDDIYIRMDNVEDDTKENRQDINDLESRVKNLEIEHKD